MRHNKNNAGAIIFAVLIAVGILYGAYTHGYLSFINAGAGSITQYVYVVTYNYGSPVVPQTAIVYFQSRDTGYISLCHTSLNNNFNPGVQLTEFDEQPNAQTQAPFSQLYSSPSKFPSGGFNIAYCQLILPQGASTQYNFWAVGDNGYQSTNYTVTLGIVPQTGPNGPGVFTIPLLAPATQGSTTTLTTVTTVLSTSSLPTTTINPTTTTATTTTSPTSSTSTSVIPITASTTVAATTTTTGSSTTTIPPSNGGLAVSPKYVSYTCSSTDTVCNLWYQVRVFVYQYFGITS